MAIGNTASSYYIGYNIGRDDILPWFSGLGSIPAFIFLPLVPAIKKAIGKKRMFYSFLGVAIIGMAMLYVVTIIPSLKSQLWLIYFAQFVKSTGVIVATGYMWVLVPEVISYGEWKTGKRISGIVNALTGIFFKAGFALGGAVPLLVLAVVGFNKDLPAQTAFTQQGILCTMTVIPVVLLVLAMFIISKYELDDDTIDKMNREIEEKHLK
jgi:GPH family glycoside/pentoside/hexuronide:cation symporter